MTVKQKRVRDNVSLTLLKFVTANKVSDENLTLLIKACEENNLTRLNIICTMANYSVPKEVYQTAKKIVLEKFHYKNDTAQKKRKSKKIAFQLKMEEIKKEREEEQKRMCSIVTKILRGEK